MFLSTCPALLLPSPSALLVHLDPRPLRKKPLCVRAVRLACRILRPTQPNPRFPFPVFRVQERHPMDCLGACLPITPSGSTRFLCKWAISPRSWVVLITPNLLHSDVTSEESTIQLNIYDRADEDHGFMGCVQVRPTLVHDHTVDQWYKYVIHIVATTTR